MKYNKRILALLLACSLAVTPEMAYAAEPGMAEEVIQTEELSAEEDAFTDADEVTKEPVIVEEITAYRDSNSKHFRMSDGSVRAQIYAEPIHYEKDGAYLEIDHTIYEAENGFRNGANSYEAVFSDGTEETLVHFKENEYEISWKMVTEEIVSVEETVTASIESKEPKEEIDSPEEEPKEEIDSPEEEPEEEIDSPGEELEEEIDLPEEAPESPEEEMEPPEEAEPESPEEEPELVLPEIPSEPEISTPEIPVVGARAAGKNKKILKDREPKGCRLSKDGESITYEGMQEDVSLQYEAEADGIKESIIVESPQEEYRYQFELSLKGLTPVLSEDGGVDLFGDDELQYRIPAPYMVDAEGNYSDAASYSLVGQEDGTSILTVEADKAWMDAASYPVIIDPVLKRAKLKGVTDFKTVRSSGKAYTGRLVGRKSGVVYRTYLRFDMPQLPVDAVISKALLQTKGGSVLTHTYQVREAWDEETITWESQPFKGGALPDERVLDYAKPSTYFEITRAVRKWHKGEPNYGLAFMGRDEEEDSYAEFDLITTDVYLEITYRVQGGLTSYWSTHDFDAGRAGSGSIRDFSGGLTYIVDDVETSGNRMPMAVTHVYNSEKKDEEKDPFTRLGKGWSLNYQQTLKVPYDELDLEKYAYVYTDGDGSRHYFKIKDVKYLLNGVGKEITGSVESKYPSAGDEDGLGLYVVPVLDETLKITYPWKIVNKSGSQTLYFDKAGRLAMITDSNQKENKKNAQSEANDKAGITKEENRILIDYEPVPGMETAELTELTELNELLLQLKVRYGTDKVDDTELFAETYAKMLEEKENSPYIGTNYRAAKNFVLVETAMQYIEDNPEAVLSTKLSKVKSAIEKMEIVLTQLEGVAEVYHRRISGIEDAVGNRAELAYDEEGMLVSMTDPTDADNTVTYGYGTAENGTEGRLVSLTEPAEQGSCSYGYTNGYLSSVSDPDGYQVQLEWTGASVTGVQEYAGNGAVKGQGYTMEYEKDSSTSFRFSGTDDILGTADDIVNVYTFDEKGRTLATYSTLTGQNEIIGASAFTYTDGSEEGANKIKESAQSGRTVINLLQNHSFEYDDGTWIPYKAVETSKDKALTFSENYSYIGNHKAALRISGTEGQVLGVKENRHLEAGTYTLSGYIRTEELEGEAYLAVRGGGLDVRTEGISGSTDPEINNAWQRTAVTFTLSTASDVEVICEAAGTSGLARIDCLQLETGELANPYNILEDGSFELGNGEKPYKGSIEPAIDSTKWTHNEVTTEEKVDGSYSYHITGEPGCDKQVVLRAVVTGKSSSYILSGWYKTDTTPIRDKRRLSVVAYDPGTKDSTGEIVGINKQSTKLESWPDGWRYFSIPLKKADWGRMQVQIHFYDNIGDLYIDGLQLIKNEIQTRSYTDTGKLTSKTFKAKTSKYTYTYDRVKTENTPGGNELTYTYDNVTNDVTKLEKSVGPETYYKYDKFGNQILERTYTGEDPMLLYQNTYTEDGNFSTGSIDTRGFESKVSYDPVTGLLMKETNPQGTVTTYEYDEKELLTKTSSEEVEVTYTYDGDERLTGMIRNGFSYGFSYDSFGNATGNTIAQTPVVSYDYGNGNGKILKTEYANGYTTEPVYNELEQQVGEKRDGVDVASYEYDSRGNLGRMRDLRSGQVATYTYDIADRVTGQQLRDTSGELLNHLQYTYDSAGHIYIASYGIHGDIRTSKHTYRKDDIPDLSIYPSKDRTQFSYDTLRRQSQAAYAAAYDTADSKKMYVLTTYEDGVSSSTTRGGTTTLVKTWTNRLGTKSAGIKDQYTYTYDELGNIRTITDKAGKRKTYTYDLLSQLIREDDENAGTTTLYTYDGGGNLCAVTTYAYTTEEPSGAPLFTETYGYDSVWKDKLVSYNGQSITYDAIGNPLIYLDRSFEWEDGRNLKKITGTDGSTITYTYGVDGSRIGKTVTDSSGASTETSYMLEGDKILYERTGDETIYYSYDSGGNLWSIDYKKGDADITGYYVTRNAQGDICAIYNRSNNALVGTYQYDTWGNILSITADSSTSDPNGILEKNPFRYRGYYYDAESGFYYLKSRYYNPQVRRFLNADNLIADTKNGLGYNLFVYSNNNPVNYKDESGHTPDTVFDIIAIGVDIVELTANPANPMAWISLGADVVCLIVPVVSGGGAAAKAFGTLDEGIDAIKSGTYTNLDDGLNFSNKALEHMGEAGRQVPVQTLQDAIRYGEAMPDPRGSSATMYYTTMYKNRKMYNLEVLYDEVTNTVYHFEYARKAMGNLPAISK